MVRVSIFSFFIIFSIFCFFIVEIRQVKAEDDCWRVLEYGTYDLVRTKDFWSSNSSFRREACEKYKKISRSSDSVAAEGHYYLIGGQGKYSRARYDELGKWACEKVESSESIKSLQTRLVRTLNPKVYDTYMLCKQFQQQGIGIRITRAMDDKRVTIALKDNMFHERKPEYYFKLSGIYPTDNHFKNFVGKLWSKKDSDFVIDNNWNMLTCDRIMKLNSKPGAIIAEQSNITLHSSKDVISVDFGEIRNPPKEPPPPKKIISYEINYRTKYLNRNVTVTLQPNSGTFPIYDQEGGCGPNDIARFSISNHILQTYIKDSCSPGSNGNQVNLKTAQPGAISRATAYGYWLECKLVKKNYSK